MKNVIFIAPPSAGKGTQSKILINSGYTHMSTGDMLRLEISKNTVLGKEIESIIQKGDLVSDEIVFKIIKDNLKIVTKPFILDGYPRTINQAIMLDNIFNELNIYNYEVIYLDISMEDSIKRVVGRLSCPCGASYNINYKELSPTVDGICDKCGNKLFKRNDDNEESLKKRFMAFQKNIESIINFYKEKGKFHAIDALKESEIIADEIKEILK